MCDTIIAQGSAPKNAGVLFGKNSDRDWDEPQHLEMIPARIHRSGDALALTHVCIPQTSQTFRVLLSKPHWIWGAEMGANEHDLVVGNEAIFSVVPASAKPGIIGMDFVRLALERAQDVDEAIAVITSLLEEHGQSGNCSYRHAFSYHNSFVIADRQHAKVLETIDRDWAVRTLGERDAVSNGITIESQFDVASNTLGAMIAVADRGGPGETFSLKRLELPARVASAEYRRGRAIELAGAAANNPLDVTNFFAILRDHVEGPAAPGRPTPRLCAHWPDAPIAQTTASWVSELGRNGAIHWVTGTSAPCTSIFKPLLVSAEPPEHGPRPTAARDNESLWWRHESIRTALDLTNNEVREGFDAERHLLEQRFVQRMSAFSTLHNDARECAKTEIAKCWAEAQAFEQRWSDELLGRPIFHQNLCGQ